MEHYIPLVWKIAAQQAWSRPIETEELVTAATIGLMQAIESFDSKRGVKFTTHAGNRIRGAILDELRELDWVPRLERRRMKQGEAVTVPQFHPLVDTRQPRNPEAENFDVAYECDPGTGIDRLDGLRESLRGMSKVERCIVISYYWEQKTMRETAESLGLSESRISQILSALYERLKECRNEASHDHP